VENYLSSTLPEYERFKEVHRLLRNYPVRLPLVADFLQEHRQELHEIKKLRAAYVEIEPKIFNTFAFFYESWKKT